MRIRFINGSQHPHTIHFHGFHPDFMDGMPGVGEERGGGMIETGETLRRTSSTPSPSASTSTTATSMPLAAHIAKGLYGAMIIDPKEPRPEADELVMVMNGFDTNFDGANEFYAVNTIPFHYVDEPIKVKRGELVRIYLVNLLEFDQINSFHIHANFFDYYPTGTRLRAHRVHRHGRSRARASAGSSSCASPTRASSCSTPTRPSSPSSAGWASSRWRTDGGRRRHRAICHRAARPGCSARSRWSLIAVAIGLFAALGGPGLGERPGPPVEELAVERTELHPGEIELTLRNDGPDAVDDRPGDRERRVRPVRGQLGRGRSARLDDR